MTDLLAMWQATADCAQMLRRAEGTGASQAEA